MRVSTIEQNTIRQEVLMRDLGVEKVFIDKCSGKSRAARHDLEKMMDFIREGDTVVVESISRFARSVRDLLDLVDALRNKGVEFISKKEAIDTSTPQGKFMLTVWAAMAELEREQILERQAEGIAIAKAAGKYTGRKPIDIPEERMKEVHRQWYNDEITTAFAIKQLGVSRNTFYRRMWGYEDTNGIPRKGRSNS